MNNTIIILAAGHGRRMNSCIPKVLHKIGNFSMLDNVIHTSKQLNYKNILVVVNSSVREKISSIKGVELLTQELTLGTGNAVKIAIKNLSDSSIVVVLYGDTPLVKSNTIASMVAHLKNNAFVCLGFKTTNQEYGRLVIENNNLKKIEEHSDDRKYNNEFFANAGVLVGHTKHFRELIEQIEPNNFTGEYYLTDIISIATQNSLPIGYIIVDEKEAIGVNNRHDLAKAERYFQKERRKYFIDSGVMLTDSNTVFFSLDTQIGNDTIIEPYVFFGPGVTIEPEAKILSFSHLENCLIKKDAIIGPFTRIKDSTIIDCSATVGNFVEIKQSTVGKKSKIKHLSYIGDTEIGHNSNLGAGTIVCNYDGKNKHKTMIGNSCFIGANSSLIAPINISDDAKVAAGSVIVEDVPKGNLAIARKRQINKKSNRKKLFTT